MLDLHIAETRSVLSFLSSVIMWIFTFSECSVKWTPEPAEFLLEKNKPLFFHLYLRNIPIMFVEREKTIQRRCKQICSPSLCLLKDHCIKYARCCCNCSMASL